MTYELTNHDYHSKGFLLLLGFGTLLPTHDFDKLVKVLCPPVLSARIRPLASLPLFEESRPVSSSLAHRG